MVEDHVDFCCGRGEVCEFKRLDTSHLPVDEVWEVRTMPPDACRVFGWFAVPCVFIAATAESRSWLDAPRSREKKQKRWDRKIRETAEFRRLHQLPSHSSSALETYF
jgi:hypothetical protein